MGDPRSGFLDSAELRISRPLLDEIVVHCLSCYPEEGCGLLVGSADGRVEEVHPTENLSHSAVTYTLDPRSYLRIDRAAEESGRQVIGVFHSHTHTDPWPSPTDVAQAPDPGWHYVLVSLRHELPATRSYRILDGNIHEELVVVNDR